MAKKHYDEWEVLRKLDRLNGIRIDRERRTITAIVDNGSVGIHSWGKLDFLVKHCGWHVFARTSESISQERLEQINAYKEQKKAARANAKCVADGANYESKAPAKQKHDGMIKSSVLKNTRAMKSILKQTIKK